MTKTGKRAAMLMLGLALGSPCLTVRASEPSSQATQPAFRPAPDLPETSDEDLVLLVRNVRAAIRDKIMGKPERSARYYPPALKAQMITFHATLRREGAPLIDTEVKPMNPVDASVAAGAMIGRSLLDRKLKADVESCGLEMEWFGPTEPIPASNDEQGKWTDALLHSFEPGIEGVGVEFRGRRGWTRPSQVIALNYTPDVAVQAAEKIAGIMQLDKLRTGAEVKYFRFRTRHVWQADARAAPIVLTRGTTVVGIDEVSEPGLDAAISRIGKYLRYRQNSDGWYSEEYLPTADRYTAGNSAAVQMRALHGLAMFGGWTGDPAICDAAAKGIARSAVFLTPLQIPQATQPSATQPTSLPTKGVGRLLVFPGHSDYLRVSADLFGAMGALPQRPDFDVATQDLVEAFLAIQDDSGRIAPPLAPGQPEGRDDVGAGGMVFAALARVDQAKTESRIEQSLRRAEQYYQDWYKRSAEPEGAAQIARALCLAYVATNDARTSDLAFSILDRFVALQLGPASCAWPDLFGAMSVGEPGVVGADTAAYLSALSEGLMVARRVGDTERVRRYGDAARNAARFIIQLEIRDGGTYYIRGRRDALGGIRKSPWNNEIRADCCSDGLMGLMAARSALYGPKPSAK